MRSFQRVVGIAALCMVVMGASLMVARRDAVPPKLVVMTNQGQGTALYAVDPATGTPAKINENPRPSAHLMTISPNGRWFVYGDGFKLYRGTQTSNHLEEIRFSNPSVQASWHSYHQWSSDGRWLVAEVTETDTGYFYPNRLYRIDITQKRAEPLNQFALEHPHHLNTFVFPTPDQNGVTYYAYQNDEVDLYHVDIASMQEHRLSSSPDLEYLEGWTVDGKWLIYWSSYQATLFRVRRDGTDEQKLLAEANSEWLAYEPFDEWLYLNSRRDELDGGELYRVRLDGTELTRLTNMEGYERLITRSPDGEWLYFLSGPTQPEDLYRMHPDGTALEPLIEGLQYGDGVGWSADGAFFYFVTSAINQTTQLVRLDAKSHTLQPVGAARVGSVWMTPDHTWLAYRGAEESEPGVWFVSTASGMARHLRLPFADFSLHGWWPRVEREGQPEAIMGGGVLALLGVIGISALHKRRQTAITGLEVTIHS